MVTSPWCVRVEGLTYRYAGEILALDGIDLEIRENAYLAIVGQNGSGKTTLIKHFNGLLKPTRGCVKVFGVDTQTASVAELARHVGFVFQNPEHQISCPTTRDEISFGPRNLGLTPAQVQTRTEEALHLFGLADLADTPPAVLGYGLRRKVCIAAVYAMRPRLLMLDEPTAGLDGRSAGEMLQLTQALHAEGHTIILVTHDMRLAAEHAESMLVMHQGRILLKGVVRQVFGHAGELRQAQIMLPQVTELGRRLGRWGFPGNLLTVEEFCQVYGDLQHRAGSVRRGQ